MSEAEFHPAYESEEKKEAAENFFAMNPEESKDNSEQTHEETEH